MNHKKTNKKIAAFICVSVSLAGSAVHGINAFDNSLNIREHNNSLLAFESRDITPAVHKYGGPMMEPGKVGNIIPVVHKYGGPMIKPDTPSIPAEVKYGGPMMDSPNIPNIPAVHKYGGPMINPPDRPWIPVEVKYGGPMMDIKPMRTNDTSSINTSGLDQSVLNPQNADAIIRAVEPVVSDSAPKVTDTGVDFGKDVSILGRFLFK